MISSIVIAGYLQEMINTCFRKIKVNNVDACHQEEQSVSYLPLLYWTRDKNNLLNKLPLNQYVIVKGRIEQNEEIGLYILVETVQRAT